MPPTVEPTNKNKHSFSIDLRVIILLLLLVIGGMIAVWKPWNSATSSDRTVTVTGEATISQEPDEYTFYPTYEFKDTNKDTALASLTKKSEEIVAKLKELGVASSKIKVNADGYDYKLYYFNEDTNQFTYTLRPVAIVGDKEIAQKVQDYLITTSPSGQVSPQAGFSDALQKTVEDKARDEASKDARAKADQSAKNLGFKVSKVKSVSDGTSYGGIEPYFGRDTVVSSEAPKDTSLTIQPGENELVYSVTVVYYIR
jgi:uncharacterized protein YggE